MKGWKGLLLALAVAVVGCQGPLQVAFSPDSKMVVYEDRGVGFVVRKTANHKLMGFYPVGDVTGMTWSGTGRYLIYASRDDSGNDKHPGRTRILDLKSGGNKLLPLYMTPPFNWHGGDSLVTGQASRESEVKGKKVTKHLEVTYQVDTGVFERRDAGQYFVLEYVPGSGDAIVSNVQDIFRRTGKGQLQKLPTPADFPFALSMAIAPGGDALIVTSRADRRGVTNALVSIGPERRASIPIPGYLMRSPLSHRQVLRLMGVSPDSKWLVVAKVEDRSKHPMLSQLLANEGSHFSGKSTKKTSKRDVLLIFTYSLVDRATGSSRVICSSTSIGMFGVLASESWSKDGCYMSLSTAEPLRAVMCDVQTGEITSLGDMK